MSANLLPSKLRERIAQLAPTCADELSILIDKAEMEQSFYAFVKGAWHVVEGNSEFRENWHISAICLHLQAVSEGKIKRLLINVPPSFTKSLLTCVFWPAWEWTSKPWLRYLCSSYVDKLSGRDALKCRNLILSPWYQARWPLAMRREVNAATLYENMSGGWRMSTSTAGAATGYHPSRVLCDDPNKVNDVESDLERQAVNDWWDGTISTRGIMLEVAQVIIMQRLHSEDLSGHVLKKGTWDHLVLPMHYDPEVRSISSIGWKDPRSIPGELLWPSVFTPKIVDALAKTMGPYHAAGQLEQRPVPRGGGMFKREWFEIIPAVPANILSIVRYFDKAGTAGGDGCRTAGVLMAKTKDGMFIVLDLVAGRWDAVERERVIKLTAHLDKARYGYVETWTEQEPGSGGKESAEATVRNLGGFTCKIERVTGSKFVRIEPFASQCAVRNVKLLEGAWNGEYIAELEVYGPTASLLDIGDASGGAFNKLDLGTGAIGGIGDIAHSAFSRRDKLDVFERIRFDKEN